METISRSGLTDTDNVLKSGKKLGDEITRIQNKIEELESKKKKLNIEFTPFSMKNRSASVIGTVNQPGSIDSRTKQEESKVS